MTFDDVFKKIQNKNYESKLPYPPYRADKKEKEKFMVIDREAKQLHSDDSFKLQQLFTADMRLACNDFLNIILTDVQFYSLFDVAWDNGHANGYSEIYNEIINLITLAKEFIDYENTTKDNT